MQPTPAERSTFMIISTQTDVLAQRFSQEEAIRILAKAGYDAFDISLFSMLRDDDIFNSDSYLDYTLRLKEIAQECGIVCNQAHAPFPSSKGDDVYNATIFPRIVRAMEIAATLGAKQIIVHPVQHLYYLENAAALKQMNHTFYKAL
jgi:sugar phosphate isomerase/epimerase